MTSAIYTENLQKVFSKNLKTSKVHALKGVSLQIDEGETFGFIGQNGAGKSTLIKILTGVLYATSGEASLFGQDVRHSSARIGLGYVPESPSLYDFLTPLEIMMMGLDLHKTPVRDKKKHCLIWLDRLELGHVANKQLKTFSKGMTQRVALAHALAIKPRLLILDEPLSGLDPVGRKDVIDILDEYRKSGGTLFFSSHVLYDVERIADRFGLIHKGELLTIRSPQEVVADQADRYVLRYRGDEIFSNGINIREGLYEIEASVEELPRLIESVSKSDGIIQEIKPKASLEAIFFKTIEH